MLEKPVPTSEEPKMLQHHSIQFVIARDHVNTLRREARQARQAADARRHGTRPSRRSR